MALSEAQRRANDKWQKENCEFIKVRLGKGEKDKVKAAADAEGKSINAFIKGRIIGGNNMIKSIEKLYDELGFENPHVVDDIKNDILTEACSRNGRRILWYLEPEGKEAAIDVDTMQFLTDEEIEKDLC